MLAAAALIGALFALPRTDAGFSDVTDNTGSAFTADTLDPPTGLIATDGTTVTLDWTATIDTYADGHRIYRSAASGGPYTQVAEITPRTTVTHIDSPAPGTYYYVARAFYGTWESANSNQATATAGTTTPIVDSSSSWSGSGITESWTHTVGAGSNRILIVTTATKNEQTNSVTFNAQPMTLIGRQNDADNASRIAMWYRINPATGPGTIQVTFSGGIQEKTMGASSWSGVHQTTPTGTFVSQAGSGTTPSITLSSAPGEVVVDAASNIDAGSITVDPSQVEHWNLTLVNVSGGHSSETGAASVTMSWTMPTDFWAIGAVTLKPA